MANNKSFKVKNGLELQAYNKAIADTAVDIFVYDTRKDSDGGAWRKRTQGTSWYNETLNTAARGSRKEFPAVAVIVVDNTGQVIIYDGDDPDMPMWMLFEDYFTYTGGGIMRTTTAAGSLCVSMQNGELVVGNGRADGGLVRVRFIADDAIYYSQYSIKVALWPATVGIENRNVGGSWQNNGDTNLVIASSVVNDIAMTVLPNAPIDAATGLPVPTIAVATAGGLSVIRDDGNVYDIAFNSYGFNKVDFQGDEHILAGTRNIGPDGSAIYVNVYPIPLVDSGATMVDEFIVSRSAGVDNGAAASIRAPFGDGGYDITNNGDTTSFIASNKGLLYYTPSFNDTTATTSMGVGITSDYNTGWMNGDIKLATLSDTDATNVTGSELVTNGTFDSDTSGWTTTNFTQSSGVITSSTANSQADQTITTVSGKTYTISFDITANHTDNQNGVYIRNSDGSSYADFRHSNETGSFSGTFTATGSSMIVRLYNGSTAGTISFDNISVRLAEEDRSVNGNGLQVFGTVTKSKGGSDRDIVSYSGFDNGGTSYLEQPYNSGLDFSGDFCFIAWVYGGDADTAYPFSYGGPNGGGSDKLIFLRTLSSSYQFGTYDATDGTNTITGPSVSNNWHCLCGLRRGGTVEFYHNGVLQGSYTRDYDFTGTSTHKVRVGLPPWNTGPFNVGSVSLARISETAPSPEQIKKIYEDEKVLFQENAQATLYGSSDAVTALAYDDSTELLHVGTSAGRSDFQGLRRVNNTTTAVGSAISASNGLIADD